MSVAFSNVSGRTGLVQRCEQTLFGDNGFGKISGNTSLLYAFANFANEALDWYGAIALKSSSRWRFDPSTYTTFPEAYTDLVASQADYTLDVNFLAISTVQIRDANDSQWILLSPVSDQDIKDMGSAPAQYQATPGTPAQYKKLGGSLFLLPPTSYSVTNGLKLTIERGFAYFTYDDTTDTVGIPDSHARFVHDYMSWLYARDRGMAIAQELEKRVMRYEQVDIPSHYSTRTRDQRQGMSPLISNTR